MIQDRSKDLEVVREVLFEKGMDAAFGPICAVVDKYDRDPKGVGRDIGLLVAEWVKVQCTTPGVAYEGAIKDLVESVDVKIGYDVLSKANLDALKAMKDCVKDGMTADEADLMLMNAYNVMRDEFLCDVFPKMIDDACMAAIELFCAIEEKVGKLNLSGPCRNWRVVETITQLMVAVKARTAQLDQRAVEALVANPGNTKKAWNAVKEVFDRGNTEAAAALAPYIETYIEEMFPIVEFETRRAGRRAAVKKGRY